MTRNQLEAIGLITINQFADIRNIYALYGNYHVVLLDRDGMKEVVISRDGTTKEELWISDDKSAEPV